MADTTKKADAEQPAPDLTKIAADAKAEGFAEASEIVELCALANKTSLAPAFIKDKKSAADVRTALLEAQASESDEEDINSHIEAGASGADSEDEKSMTAMADRKRAQIAARKGGK